MLITLEEYKIAFRWESENNFRFRDCVVRSKDIFSFISDTVLSEEQAAEYEKNGWNPELRPKIATLFGRNFDVGRRWSSMAFSWNTTVNGVSEKPLSQTFSIEKAPVYPDMDFRVFVNGSGVAYEDKPIKPGNFLRGAIGHLKTLDGWLYVCGGGRSLGKRLDKGKWKSFSKNFTLPKNHVSTVGFHDFDGWGENDIYLGGTNGDFWHFDGRKAYQIALPTNEDITTICCGGDGKVYLSGRGGIAFWGRNDVWEPVISEVEGDLENSSPFRDMVWYEDKIWCTNDYGVWIIENGIFKKAHAPSWINECSGDLSVGDGVLLLSGFGGAAFCENGTWHKLIFFDEMNDLFEADTDK